MEVRGQSDRKGCTQRGHLDGNQVSVPKFRLLWRSVNSVSGPLVTCECSKETATRGWVGSVIVFKLQPLTARQFSVGGLSGKSP